MVVVVNVAEKPSVAKGISQLLSGNQGIHSEMGKTQYNRIFRFQFEGNQHVFTSVTGHLMEMDFDPKYRSWYSCNPGLLLDSSRTSVFASVKDESIARNLHFAASGAQQLNLWLDGDAEGEAISEEVVKVIRQKRPAINVKRARFSAITRNDVLAAIHNLDNLNPRVVDMVETRQEIDLRAGAAFTRFLTQTVQSIVDHDSVISFGPCQFPTLGLVVARYLEIQEFDHQEFYLIDLETQSSPLGVPPPAGTTVFPPLSFLWRRGRLFCQFTANNLYETCTDSLDDPPIARVSNVRTSNRTRFRPLPLSTVELQKEASRKLRIASSKTMELAEKMYQDGIISYPRTETDRFNPNIDLKQLVAIQTSNQRWGSYAESMLQSPDGTFTAPREGKNDDQAHPPIHPTGVLPPSFGNHEAHKCAQLYEYITRRFLAACSPDARAAETELEVDVGQEKFSTKGLTILVRGYLEIFKYEKWGEREMPPVQPGQFLMISKIELKSGRTEAPPLLSEADLIAKMDQHGIGTDATIAEHVKKIQERQYVSLVNARFHPGPLGLALVEGHERCDVYLARPDLRSDMERSLKSIAEGMQTKEEVLASLLSSYKESFGRVLSQRLRLQTKVAEYYSSAPTGGGDDGGGGGGGGNGGGQDHGNGPGGGASDNAEDQDRSGGPGGNMGGPGQTQEVSNLTAKLYARILGSAQLKTSEFSRCGECNSMMNLLERNRNLFLLCVICEQVNKLPRLSEGSNAGSQHSLDVTCPICNFQVVSTLRQLSNGNSRESKVCPKCFTNPPGVTVNPDDLIGDFSCNRCSHPDCGLAEGLPSGSRAVGVCPACKSQLELRSRNGFRISCSSGISCKFVYFLPKFVARAEGSNDQACERCASKLINIKFNTKNLPPEAERSFEGCIWCSSRYRRILASVDERPPPSITAPPPDLEDLKPRKALNSTIASRKVPKKPRSTYETYSGRGKEGAPPVLGMRNSSGAAGSTKQHAGAPRTQLPGGSSTAARFRNQDYSHQENRGGLSCPQCQKASLVCLMTKKEGPNQGREFLKCQECGFFQFKDEFESRQTGNHAAAGGVPQRPNSDGEVACPECRQPLVHAASKSAKNPGKWYYGHPTRQPGSTCDFFAWDEEFARKCEAVYRRPGGNPARANRGRGRGRGRGAGRGQRGRGS